MAFDNLSFRQCSYTYNENGASTDKDNGNVSSETKDIGNGAEDCIKIKLGPMNTVWNPDVAITSQIDVFFQFTLTSDTTPVDPLSLVPVEYRQGLFRLPRWSDTAQTVAVYKAERTSDSPILYISKAKVALLEKTTRPDGSLIIGYDGTAQTIKFPAPTESMEYTVKRLTHSKTDFVTYQPSSKLTANVLNFQKEQEMYLLQEILWTIEMDMVTFTDLSGKGSVITAEGDGTIPVDQINLSIYDLNDTSASELSTAGTVFYKRTSGSTPLWEETPVNNLISLNKLSDVTLSGLTLNHVLAYDGTKWINASPSALGITCGEKLADPLKLCNASGPHPTQAYTDALIATDSWSTSNSVLLTTGGLTKAPIETLSNVSITSAAVDNLLQYNGTNWVNVTPGSVTGLEGQAGGSTFLYEFDSAITSSGIGTGEIRFDNASLSSVSEVYVHTTDDNGGTVTGWLESFDDNNETTARGTLKIFKKGSPQVYILLKVTGSIAEGSSTFRTITTTFIASNGSFSDADKVWVSFLPTGDKGETGETGADSTVVGPQGDQGKGFKNTGGSIVAVGDDLRFTFEMEDPANPSTDPADLVIDLAGWDQTAVTVGRITDTTIIDYGRYSYSVCLDDSSAWDASCTGTTATGVRNGAEWSNVGTTSTASRTFQGITYDGNASWPEGITSQTQKVHGVHTATGDIVKLMPIPVGTIVFIKIHSATSGQKWFTMQNPVNIVICG